MTTDHRIKKILIVGGGTAGWMAAAAFSEMLGRDISITLVESDQIGTIGVGEATIPNIQTFNRLLDIDEAEFMRETQATFKLGIEFESWKAVGESYLHPFGSSGVDMFSVQFHHYWLRAKQEGFDAEYSDFSLACQAAPKLKFSHPKNISNSPLSNIKYAYHFDAGLYAKFLRRYAEKRSVTREEGLVSSVEKNADSGCIESVTLQGGRCLSADFFIDCSGFKGLLIKDALNVGFEDWSHWLPCDRAVAVPSESRCAPQPYTRSSAKAAGWQWRIPLQHRVGNGHVYCSDYMSDDEAVSSLIDDLEGEPLAEPNFIRFTTGRRHKLWEKNCVALGLASGFMEPLESTSIHLIQTGIVKLLGLFPDKHFAQAAIDKYNVESAFEYEKIRDFLILHYHINQREEPFWAACRNMPIPDYLRNKMALFTGAGHCTRDASELFAEPSWLAVMLGQGLSANNYNHIVDRMPAYELKQRIESIRQVITRSADSLPSHEAYLKGFCASNEYTWG